MGVYVSLLPVVLVDLVGIQQMTSSFGFLNLVNGVGGIIGAPLAGWVYDLTRSYDSAFHLMGVIFLISGLMLYPIPLIQTKRLKATDSISKGTHRT